MSLAISTKLRSVRNSLTLFDYFVGFMAAAGGLLVCLRFAKGLGAVTNLSQDNPWGIWKSLNLFSGVALAAGGYTIATAVYLFGLKKYTPLLRPAILTGFLGYTFAVTGLIFELGLPWRMPSVLFLSRGVTSVLFEIAWCVALYLTVQALEFSPVVWEWIRWPRAAGLVHRLTLPAAVLGLMLSTLHQSSLGALFLMAPTKLHPLWYSPYLPLYFFISSIIGGLSMVIVESRLSRRLFIDRVDPTATVDLDGLTLGLGKAAAVVLYVYFFIKVIGVAESGEWELLATPYGRWFLVEVLGFIALPCLLYTLGVRRRNAGLVRITGAITLVGIVLNRFNVTMIAFNWTKTQRYVPTWMEIVVSLTLVTLGVYLFRWAVIRLPVLGSGTGSPELQQAS